ncbi:MAG: UDP-N-acetylmuramoyl-L-alanyl-D-glutamate--2,6-diaminopimelate ligase [Alphaproteobacteria bacterium]|nr:UDP-N-acetylmuramoyl-L-alanyl-D-glutamate--2,6-diaminopimelate ligase [Alphaproteobacteria bacterium]
MDPATAPGPEIAGLTADSRRVEPGFLFAALTGAKSDGRTFVKNALERGAVAVLGSPGLALPAGAAVRLSAANPRRAYARLAARFFARQPETVAAVTGTNGKTSSVHFLRQIWSALGLRAASIGTLGVVGADGTIRPSGGLTTPDPADLHRLLKELAEGGVGHLAMEASSHGLDQHRLDGVGLKAAAFTNLTRDHLDYHADMGAYLAAKRRLFTELLPADGAAVVHKSVPGGEDILEGCRRARRRIVTYGPEGADIALLTAEPSPSGQRLDLSVFGKAHAVSFPLVGGFQADNALCALGLAIACGADANRAVASLARLVSVPGRLEKAGETGNGAAVYVDYAHTPDALANVLAALRPHACGRLIVVFGCGGDRDAGKRPEMGRVAAAAADAVIVTDDNPRSEDAALIRRAILAACPGASEIADRRQAIRAAVAGLRAGDVLVLAGKGHEQGQIVGTEIRPFDDRAEARAALAGGGA